MVMLSLFGPTFWPKEKPASQLLLFSVKAIKIRLCMWVLFHQRFGFDLGITGTILSQEKRVC